jgi:prevent-host-death family protein
MHEINIAELRKHLPKYLSDVTTGNEILVTSHGKFIARILPPINVDQEAKEKLQDLQKICKVGDIITSIGDLWEVEK